MKNLSFMNQVNQKYSVVPYSLSFLTIFFLNFLEVKGSCEFYKSLLVQCSVRDMRLIHSQTVTCLRHNAKTYISLYFPRNMYSLVA